RNRLLLARLFARPANVLVLDEPTNDLDIDTLDLLEELLENYEGTVFLVSHDRTFLDNVVTSTIAFEGNGLWREYEGGVQDWLLQSKRSRALNASTAASLKADAGNSDKNVVQRLSIKPEQLSKKKLSYKEQRELDQLPTQIAALEAEQQDLQQALADGSLYGSDPARAAAMTTRASVIDEELMTALERWTQLSN
ncbi:MAG: ABC transporter ATP-binding protein, partial [Burkholderiaceae bacterium]|nr:ABC transporter ATP-binding protein [Burkholderiaceae bacterium]